VSISQPVRDSDLDLCFAPALEQVSAVREFLQRYYEGVISDRDTLERLVMAAHELLENAAKYRAGGVCQLHVGRQIRGGVDHALVSVTNEIDRARMDDLKALSAEIDGGDDPDIYGRILRRASERKVGSGLGLARIRFEGEMELRVSFDGPLVSITASVALPATDR
jgi:hypothetical protein